MQIIDMAPTKSFGKHDYVIARAVVAREHRNANLGETNIWNSKPESVLQLVKSRLELALAGGLPDDQALEAEQILTDVNLAIADGSYPTRYHPEYLHKLPEGNVEDLLRMLNDKTDSPWSRGRAGIALGKLYQSPKKSPAQHSLPTRMHMTLCEAFTPCTQEPKLRWEQSRW